MSLPKRENENLTDTEALQDERRRGYVELDERLTSIHEDMTARLEDNTRRLDGFDTRMDGFQACLENHSKESAASISEVKSILDPIAKAAGKVTGFFFGLKWIGSVCAALASIIGLYVLIESLSG